MVALRVDGGRQGEDDADGNIETCHLRSQPNGTGVAEVNPRLQCVIGRGRVEDVNQAGAIATGSGGS